MLKCADLPFRYNSLFIFLYYLFISLYSFFMTFLYSEFTLYYKNGYLQLYNKNEYDNIVLFKNNKYYYMNKTDTIIDKCNSHIFGIEIEIMKEIIQINNKFNILTVNNKILDYKFINWYLINNGYYFPTNKYIIRFIDSEFKTKTFSNEKYLMIEENSYHFEDNK